MTDRVDGKQVIGVWSWIAKYVVTAVPVFISPRLWTAHPYEAMGLGLCVGCIFQYLIPPRGKPTAALFIFLFLAVIAAVILERR